MDFIRHVKNMDTEFLKTFVDCANHLTAYLPQVNGHVSQTIKLSHHSHRSDEVIAFITKELKEDFY